MEETEKPRICDTCFTPFESDYLLQYHRLSCGQNNRTTVPENSVENEPPVTGRKAKNHGNDYDDDDRPKDEEDYKIEVNDSEEMESDYSEAINLEEKEEDDDGEEGNEETVFKPDEIDEKPFTCNLCYWFLQS